MSYASELEELLKKVGPFLLSRMLFNTYNEYDDYVEGNEEAFNYVVLRFVSEELTEPFKEEIARFYSDEYAPGAFKIWMGFSSEFVTLVQVDYVHLLEWFVEHRPGVLGGEKEWTAEITVKVEYCINAGEDIPKEGR